MFPGFIDGYVAGVGTITYHACMVGLLGLPCNWHCIIVLVLVIFLNLVLF